MAEGRRFKSWNILDSALIKNANGHYYGENKGLVDELLRRGETVRLFSHNNAPDRGGIPRRSDRARVLLVSVPQRLGRSDVGEA